MTSDDERNKSELFEDDEEIWNMLFVDPSAIPDGVMASKLRGLFLRFQQDGDSDGDDFWLKLLESTRNMGFQGAVSSSTKGTSQTEVLPTPAAFETELGKCHVSAVASLLHVSNQRAIELTLGALRSIIREPQETAMHLQSLLGTQALLQSVVKYHFKQRLIRVKVLAECLRMEQDENCFYRNVIVRELEATDSDTKIGGRNRGLFRRLLTTACIPFSPPTRQDLLPSFKLHEKPSLQLSLVTQRESNTSQFTYNSFVAQCTEEFRAQAEQERMEAMEALLVLLYDRLQDGVHRVDFMALLNAFQSRNTFFTGKEDPSRLAQVAGLICGECIGLWRTTSDGTDSVHWVEHHPLFSGVGEDQAAEKELEIFRVMLVNFPSQVVERRQRLVHETKSKAAHVEAPEALALLCFGLLLRLAYKSHNSDTQSLAGAYLQEFDNLSMECVTIANERGAFDYLDTVMKCLVPSSLPSKTPQDFEEEKTSYDWQLSNISASTSNLASSDQPSEATVVYSSIGREILTSTITALQEIMLPEHPNMATENISMLCSLASVVHQNNSVLCEQFWRDWDYYTSRGETTEQDDPLCHLVDSAGSLAQSALEAASRLQPHLGLEDELLSSLAPLLQLLSSLCSNTAHVHRVMTLLPRGYLRTVLVSCGAGGRNSNEEMASFSQKCLKVLDSVASLVRVGNSNESTRSIRNSLENGTGAAAGPEMLYRIIRNTKMEDVAGKALSIAADVLESANDNPRWVLSSAELFKDGKFAKYLERSHNEVVLATIRTLKGFVLQMSTVAFCPTGSEKDAIWYLEHVGQGTETVLNHVATQLAPSIREGDVPTRSTMHSIAQRTLEYFCSLFRLLRPVAKLHASQAVRQTARNIRDFSIKSLAAATSIGEAISYFATAPISLCLANDLRKTLEEANVFVIASSDARVQEDNGTYGAWSSVVNPNNEDRHGYTDRHLVGELIREKARDIQKLDLDLEAVFANGWIGDDKMICVRSSKAALELLLLWGSNAEEMISESDGALSALRHLSPVKLLVSLATVPPPVGENHHLQSIWAQQNVSALQLLIGFFPAMDDEEVSNSSSEISGLADLAIDVTAMCFTHAGQKSENGAQSASVSMALPSFQFIQGITEYWLKRAQEVADSTTSVDDINCDALTHAIRLLQMMTACVENQPHLAESLLSNRNKSSSTLTVSLIASTSQTVHRMQSEGHGYAVQLERDTKAVVKLRIASSSLGVLSALWKASRKAMLSSEGSSMLESAVETIRTERPLISEIVGLVFDPSTVLQAMREQTANEPSAHGLQALASLTEFITLAMDLLTTESIMIGSSSSSNNAEAMQSLVKRTMRSESYSLIPTPLFAMFSGCEPLCRDWLDVLTSITCTASLASLWPQTEPRDILGSFPASLLDLIDNGNWNCSYQSNVPVAARFVELLIGHAQLLAVSGAPNDGIMSLVEQLNASNVLLQKEVRLTSSWASFSRVVLSEETAYSDSNRAHFESFLSIADQTMKSLAQNLSSVEKCKLIRQGKSFLVSECTDMSRALSELLLQCLNQCVKLRASVESKSLGRLPEMVGKLLGCSQMVLTTLIHPEKADGAIALAVEDNVERELLAKELKTICSVLQGLFSTGILFLVLLETNAQEPRKNQDLLDQHCLGLIDVSSRSLLYSGGLLQGHSDSPDKTVSSFLQTTTAFLTMLISHGKRNESSVSPTSSYFASVAESFRKYGTIHFLTRRANECSEKMAPKLADGTLDLSEAFGRTGDSIPAYLSVNQYTVQEIDELHGVFMLISCVAEAATSSSELLALLSNDEIARMILENSIFHISRVTVFPVPAADPNRLLRGYLTSNAPYTQDKRTSGMTFPGYFLVGRDDPFHSMWCFAIRICASLSSDQDYPTSDFENLKSRMMIFGVKFLRSYQKRLLLCLKECLSVPFGDKNEELDALNPAKKETRSKSVFTFNLLQETREVVYLISELCTGRNLAIFEKEASDAFKLFVQMSLEVIRPLTRFLGAAAKSRELFTALDEFNPQGDFLLDPSDDMNHLLETGIPNSRHEAIRNAHFAISCCAFVMAKGREFDETLSQFDQSGSTTAGHLEKQCKIVVQSSFMLRMERSAAECASFALLVVGKVHPVNFGFVSCTPEEGASLVTKGMAIAFLSAGEGRTSLSRYITRWGKNPGLTFAKVLESDTIRQIWLVKTLASRAESRQSESETIVKAELLAAVEDVTKRKCLFAFNYAKSSSEIEDPANRDESVSLGHLILLLRWCTEEHRSVRGSELSSLYSTLAERASVLLGTEVDLHGETGTFDVVTTDVVTRVGNQVLDLYEDSSSGDEFQLGSRALPEDGMEVPRINREGKLKSILDLSTWELLQVQLEPLLNAAKRRREEIRMKNDQNALGHAGPYSRNSFFRGVSF